MGCLLFEGDNGANVALLRLFSFSQRVSLLAEYESGAKTSFAPPRVACPGAITRIAPVMGANRYSSFWPQAKKLAPLQQLS